MRTHSSHRTHACHCDGNDGTDWLLQVWAAQPISSSSRLSSSAASAVVCCIVRSSPSSASTPPLPPCSGVHHCSCIRNQCRQDVVTADHLCSRDCLVQACVMVSSCSSRTWAEIRNEMLVDLSRKCSSTAIEKCTVLHGFARFCTLFAFSPGSPSGIDNVREFY